MNRTKGFITAIVTAIVTVTTVTPVYALSSNPQDAFARNIAIQNISQNMSRYTPYGTGVLRIPYSDYIRLFRGPKVFDIDNQLCWDETKWAEGGGFDEVRYAVDYPDVAAVAGYGHNALWNHFKTVGIPKGRRAYFKPVEQDGLKICIQQRMTLDAIAIVQQCCNAGMSDREKAVAVNYAMCSAYSYDISQIGKGMLNNTGVCDDYAKIYKEAMRVLGIPCIRVVNNNHAWNEVYVDGSWYVVDVTWNDLGEDLLLVDSHPYEL